MTPEQREAKRKRDRERMRRLKAIARGLLPPEELKPVEEHKLKQELKQLRQKNQAILQDLYTANEAINSMASITAQPLVPVKRRERTSGLREATSVALLSDLHVDEKVRRGETPYANEYNQRVADRSLARFFEGYKWLINFHRHEFRIRDVLLWIGGDTFSGHIHPELVENTHGTPIETTLWLLPRLVAGIDSLLDDPATEQLHVVCSYGNHGRNTVKPYRALGAVHSYEWQMYQILAGHYKGNERVRFLADQSAHQYATLYDFDLHFHHGDETSYGGGVGGVMIPINKAVAQWDKVRRCHYHNFGHWHQYIDTGRVALNGSMIGYNAYAMAIKAEPEAPQQSFYLVDSKRGKTCRSPIWVRDQEDVEVAA